MAIGANFFMGLAGAAQDIFQSKANATGLRIKAEGTDITAEGTRLSATGQRLQAKGNIVEADNYDEAQRLANQNVEYVKQNEAVQETLQDRQLLLHQGVTKSGVAGSGLTEAGSLDILADSARQGSIAKQLMGEQALISEAGFSEQAKSYGNLAEYARYGATVQNDMAGKLDEIAGRQNVIGQRERSLANDVEENGRITAGIKTVGAVLGLATDVVGAVAGLGLPGAASGGAAATGGAAAIGDVLG